jgi:formylglycine-generating enzyme
MYKSLLIFCISIWASFLFAQAQMNVHTTSGTSTFNLSDIVDITFSQGTISEQMILVPGGTFNNGISDVTVSSFYLDKYELTQSAYQAVMNVNPSYFPNVTNGPVERVTWFKAILYCNKRSINENLTPCYKYGNVTNPDFWPIGWDTNNANHVNFSCSWIANGYRLPTEAEWEFAARGGNLTHGYTYSGSNNIDDVAWDVSNSGNTTHTVGTKTPNELGLFDMSGNVFEWCWDIWGSYPAGSQTNPTGATSGANRVARGGGILGNTSGCTVSERGYLPATEISQALGFRICRIAQ